MLTSSRTSGRDPGCSAEAIDAGAPPPRRAADARRSGEVDGAGRHNGCGRRGAVVLCASLAAAVLASGCSAAVAGPPEIVVDESFCAHCRMLVSEPRFAAAYRIGDESRVFDDVACMLASLGGEERAPARIWVHDVGSGAWLEAGEATFVRAVALRTPMAGGIVALSTPAAAAELAAEHGGRVIGPLATLLEEAAEGGTHER